MTSHIATGLTPSRTAVESSEAKSVLSSEIKQITIKVYGLCVLREREPVEGAKFLDILLVGAPGSSRAPVHHHVPRLIYDRLHEDPSAQGKVSKPLLFKKVDLSWLPTATKAASLSKDVVNLYDKVTSKELAPNPAEIPAVAGYLTVFGGGRAHVNNPKGEPWGLMEPKPPYRPVGNTWTMTAWHVAWSIRIRGALSRLEWSIDSLPGDQKPYTVPPLYPDKDGTIELWVSNLPQGIDPPEAPGPIPGTNRYVPHFDHYRHLYGSTQPWPYLVYDPKPGNKPEPMDDTLIVSTSYTCVPSGGK